MVSDPSILNGSRVDHGVCNMLHVTRLVVTSVIMSILLCRFLLMLQNVNRNPHPTWLRRSIDLFLNVSHDMNYNEWIMQTSFAIESQRSLHCGDEWKGCFHVV